MVPSNLSFWSNSRKENLEFQRKHALRNRLLRTLLCSNDVFNHGYNRKLLIRKRTSIFDGVGFLFEQLFHPVQCTTFRLCQSSSRDKLVLPEVTGTIWTSDQLPYLWGINCFGNGTRQYSRCMYQSESSHKLISYHYILSILGKIFLLWNQCDQSLAIVEFQLQSV